jgi:hypothetical protein
LETDGLSQLVARPIATPPGMTARWGVDDDCSPLPWDYDPQHLLGDSRLNPRFVEVARQALKEAARRGLRPRLLNRIDLFRTPEEADNLAGGGKQAGGAWKTCHCYGLAMDVYVHDKKGKKIDNQSGHHGWTHYYASLAHVVEPFGLFWGGHFQKHGKPHPDPDHFEFHPNWSHGAGGDFLLKVKAWAERAAAATVPNSQMMCADWMPIFGGLRVPEGLHQRRILSRSVCVLLEQRELEIRANGWMRCSGESSESQEDHQDLQGLKAAREREAASASGVAAITPEGSRRCANDISRQQQLVRPR